MKTKIISISDDQKTITHESGLVVEFEDIGIEMFCDGCIYVEDAKCFSKNHLCCQRKDCKNGIFKAKKV